MRDLGNRGEVMRPTCMMPACVSSEPSSFARSTGIWPGVRRAGLPKAEPAADAGPAAPQAPLLIEVQKGYSAKRELHAAQVR